MSQIENKVTDPKSGPKGGAPMGHPNWYPKVGPGYDTWGCKLGSLVQRMNTYLSTTPVSAGVVAGAVGCSTALVIEHFNALGRRLARSVVYSGPQVVRVSVTHPNPTTGVGADATYVVV